MSGNSKSLWQAVKTAKKQGHSFIPQNVMLNNIPVSVHEKSESFAKFFEKKVSDIVNSMRVNPLVHNGIQKMTTQCSWISQIFIECIDGLKMKRMDHKWSRCSGIVQKWDTTYTVYMIQCQISWSLMILVVRSYALYEL